MIPRDWKATAGDLPIVLFFRPGGQALLSLHAVTENIVSPLHKHIQQSTNTFSRHTVRHTPHNDLQINMR
jgi:hypothetical protein